MYIFTGKNAQFISVESSLCNWILLKARVNRMWARRPIIFLPRICWLCKWHFHFPFWENALVITRNCLYDSSEIHARKTWNGGKGDAHLLAFALFFKWKYYNSLKKSIPNNTITSPLYILVAFYKLSTNIKWFSLISPFAYTMQFSVGVIY